MPTPVARSPLNSYEGISPDDLNQLLGTHAPVVVYAPSAGTDAHTNPVISPAAATPPSFSQMFPLSDTVGSYAIDQEITWTTATMGTVLDRVVLPMSIASGLGNDLLVGLYTDSSGNPAGPPLAVTFVPREFLQPSPCANFNGVMLSPWQVGAPNTVLPANLVALTGQGFTDDGATNIFSIGGWDGATPVNFVVSAPFSGNGLGAWTQTAPLPVALANMGVAYSSGSIIVIGGQSSGSTAVNTVYTSQASSDGTVSAWNTQTVLPQALWDVAVTVIGNTNVYAVGGLTSGANVSVTNVYTAPLSAGGTIGAWTSPAASQLPVAMGAIALVQVAGWLVAIGGQTNTGTDVALTTWAAPINTITNTIGSWVPWPALPSSVVSVSLNAWVVDGNIIASTSTWCGSLAVNTGGPANGWVSQPKLAVAGGSAYSVANRTQVNGTLVAIGSGSTVLGGTAQVNSVPSISVPLHATGLANATNYHICVQQADAYSQVNTTQCALTQIKPSTAFSAVAAEGDILGGVTVASVLGDLLSGVSWNSNSVNCTVSDPSYQGLGLYTFDGTANGGAYTFSTPVGTAGIAIAAGTVVEYDVWAVALSGAVQTYTTIVNWYTSAGAYISSSPGALGYTNDSDIGENLTAPATTAFASISVTVEGGNPGDVTNFYYVDFLSDAVSYVPMSLYISGKTLKPLHVLDDIVNLQPAGWSTIAYDYAGKPVHYGESALPIVNLLSPNASNFGGIPTGGTTAGWPGTANCALSVIVPSGVPLPLSIANSNLSSIGAPAFPSPNTLLQATALQLSSSASGNMSAATATGTSGVPVVVGQYYTASAYFIAAANARNCTVTINWYTAAGAACAHASDTGSIVADTTTYWVQAYVNAVAPATAAFAAVSLKVAATGASSELHDVTLVSLAVDNSSVSGLPTQLAYFDPQSGPGGTRTFLQLVYDFATSQLVSVNDISYPTPVITGVGTPADGTLLTTYTAIDMTDTNAQWPMNGLIGWVVTVQAAGQSSSNISATTATVAFNTTGNLIFTSAGWSNGQPDNGAAYSITPPSPL